MSRVDGRPAPVRPERAWGRRHEPARPAPEPPTVIAAPSKQTIIGHLADAHGFRPNDLGQATEHQLMGMHDAEHRLRGEWVGHTHDPHHGVVLTPDEEIHQAVLRRIAEGVNPPDVAEILARVEGYIEQRRTDGLPLSPYDRRCVEISQAIADRAARRARRRGAA